MRSKQEKALEDYRAWKNQQFLDEMFIEDEGDIVPEEDLFSDDSEEKQEE